MVRLELTWRLELESGYFIGQLLVGRVRLLATRVLLTVRVFVLTAAAATAALFFLVLLIIGLSTLLELRSLTKQTSTRVECGRGLGVLPFPWTSLPKSALACHWA